MLDSCSRIHTRSACLGETARGTHVVPFVKFQLRGGITKTEKIYDY